MRLLFAALVLTIAIASCVAQPQGQAKAAASSLNRVLDLGISSASDRRKETPLKIILEAYL